ncbi:MAG: T9SS type A sorting domain-containing protein [Bacteroidales bacterium]|nr:T9SS type A sorting domain-containing protein [Bacteroidales bacterium]
MIKKKHFWFVLLCLFQATTISAQTTYFVSNSGNDSNNGLSWATAKATINGAMALITSPYDDSVFVAAGTYPACTVKNGTHVYGGFAGTETHLYQRQPLTYGIAPDSSCSIIDAQHNSNYAVQINSYFSYNGTYHCRPVDFDGFYVTGGNQYGIRDVANNTHTISNCTMTDNACGIYLGLEYSNSYYSSTFQVSDCKINGSTTNGGVKMYNGSQTYGATFEFDNCVIAENTGSQFGGMTFNTYAYNTTNYIIVNNCDVVKNVASGLTAKAGGILTQSNDFDYAKTKCEWRILNSRIIDNTVYTTATTASADNNWPYIAGGISAYTHTTHILGCVIANNSAISTEGIDVTGGVASYANGTSTSSSNTGDPVGRLFMTNCVVANNLAQTAYTNGTGGIRTVKAATIKNTVAWNNKRGSTVSNSRWSTSYAMPYTYCASETNPTSDFAADSTNIVLDSLTQPLFVAPSSMVGATTIATDLSNLVADWRVLPNSPLIDAGDPNTAFITYLPTTDMDGNPRIGNNIADIGAYEHTNTTFNQTITWNQELTAGLSDGTLSLNATATSGLPVTYTSSNESIATVSGNILTLHSPGYAIITASQSGNATWNPAADVSKILTVTDDGSDLLAQSILWEQDLTFPLSDNPVVLAAAATSGLPVQFTCSDESVATINGSILTMHSVGLAIITASQPGNDQYMAAQNVMKILNVTDPVGIDEHTFTDIRIWPNPSGGVFNVEWETTGDVNYSVFDISGKIVQNGKINTTAPCIDLSTRPDGIYFLRLVSDNGQTARIKMVKTK